MGNTGVRKNFISANLRFYFEQDYRLMQRTLVLFAFAGFVGHFLFYFVLSNLTDYWESIGLRIAAAVLFGSLLLLPRQRKFNAVEIWYYEVVYVLVFPTFFIINLFQNDVNVYWAISVMFAAIPYGLLTHPPKALILYPVSIVITSVILFGINGRLPGLIDAIFIHFPAYFMVILLGLIQTTIRKAYSVADRERHHSEELLKNILPVSIINKLKANPSTIAEKFDNCSILFIDVTEFTPFAEKAAPEKVVNILNDIFTLFDHLTEKYKLEKIKTIGDAYMVVSGVPEMRTDHAESIAEMALEVLQSVEEYNRSSGYNFSVRLGINSGPAVAGVIGSMKFAYDIWGDTVNIASRMESMSIPGKIQTSEITYEILKEKFVLNFRDTLEVKGKGKLRTYFLEGKKPSNC
jgi:class 3 adenylate cyclase